MTTKELDQIWWYGLRPGEQTIAMPAGARPLYVSMRQGAPVVYMLVRPTATPEVRRLVVVGTSSPFDSDGLLPVGVFSPEPNLFFHAFIEV